MFIYIFKVHVTCSHVFLFSIRISIRLRVVYFLQQFILNVQILISYEMIFSHDDIPLRERSYQLPSHCSVCLDSYENDVLVVHISSLIDSSSSFCKSFFTLSQLEVPKI